MDVYIYQADIYCAACGEAIRERLTREGKAPADPGDEYSYDSDDFPKGPYPDGGGEADCPQHCANMGDCAQTPDGIAGVFLENPPTDDGVRYVKECLADDEDTGSTMAQEWARFYGIGV